MARESRPAVIRQKINELPIPLSLRFFFRKLSIITPLCLLLCNAQELATNPVFIREGASVLDVVPGKLGDRWLVSTLGCLFLTKGFFYRVVPADQGFDTGLDGSGGGSSSGNHHHLLNEEKR